jgi:hypothetical protein
MFTFCLRHNLAVDNNPVREFYRRSQRGVNAAVSFDRKIDGVSYFFQWDILTFKDIINDDFFEQFRVLVGENGIGGDFKGIDFDAHFSKDRDNIHGGTAGQGDEGKSFGLRAEVSSPVHFMGIDGKVETVKVCFEGHPVFPYDI